MGGRGSNNLNKTWKVSGLAVTTKDGETVRYYFTKVNGINYYQRGVGGDPQETPLNMTPSEFKRRVESNGATTKNISVSERRKEEIKRKADREATDKYLKEQWYRAAPRPRKGMRGH